MGHIFLLDFYLLKMKNNKEDKQYLCILLTLLSYLWDESKLFHIYLRPALQFMLFKAFTDINSLWNFLSAFQQIKKKQKYRHRKCLKGFLIQKAPCSTRLCRFQFISGNDPISFFVPYYEGQKLHATVVCIKVRRPSFPKFWKNHP